MKSKRIFEFDAVSRRALGAAQHALQALDEQHAGKTGVTVFDWSRREEIRARNWVGIMQVPGLCVEIVPKVGLGDDRRNSAPRAFLHMLRHAGILPIRARADADQMALPGRLLDAIVAVFAERLVAELRKGAPHAYVTREENLSVVRGRLLTTPHARRNGTRMDRVFVAYDEYCADSLLSRALRAACRVLLGRVVSPRVRHWLAEALHRLDDVADAAVTPAEIDRLRLDRHGERFAPLLPLCRLILADETPSMTAGPRATFSLLFPMERVFQGYIASLLRRYSPEISAVMGAEIGAVHLDGAGESHFLLQPLGPPNRARLRLQPDVRLVAANGTATLAILDTKWKRLTVSRHGLLDTPDSDLYQIFAYAMRFRSPMNVLLYPHSEALALESYGVDGDGRLNGEPARAVVRVAQINLARDLPTDEPAIARELARMLAP